MQRIEAFIRRAANRFGIDIHRHRPERSESGRLARMLAANRIDLLLDVGANTGQFSRAIRDAGYCGHIVSFEPLPDAHSTLEEASRTDSKWKVAGRTALGSEDGEIDLHVAANSVSSSVLDMCHAHELAAPSSAYIRSVRVPLRRLDTLAPSLGLEQATTFLKIDAQGYEDRILDGAARVMENVAGLQLELSLVPLYTGQTLYQPLVDRLTSAGFDLWGLSPGFEHLTTGRILQVDAVFFRGRI